MFLFPLFLGFAFAVWRFAVNFVWGNSSGPSSSREEKYFVLRGRSRGQILLSVDAQSNPSNGMVLRPPGSTDDSQAEYLLSDIQLISDEVAELLSPVTCPAERFELLADSERLERSRTRLRNGSRVLVKLGRNEDEIPGVVLYKGSLGGLGGTLFAVQLEEDHGVDTERAVLFKGKTYFRQRSDSSVLVYRDRRVLVPISKLRMQTGEHRALRRLQSPRQHRANAASLVPSSLAGETEKISRKRFRGQAEAATENTPMSHDPESTATETEPQRAEVNDKEKSANPIKKRRQVLKDKVRANITEAPTLPKIRQRKLRVREESPAVGTTIPIRHGSESSQAEAWWFPMASSRDKCLDSAPGVTASERQSVHHQLQRLPKPNPDPVTTISEKQEDVVLPPKATQNLQSDSTDDRSSFDVAPRPRLPEKRPAVGAALSWNFLDFSLPELPAPVSSKPAVDRKIVPVSVRPSSSEVPAVEDRRPLVLGQRVVAFDSRERMLRGRVRYISNQQKKCGNITIGIELDEPQGFGTGTLFSTQHFTCPKDHALFVPIGAALSEDDFEGRPPTTQTTETGPPKEPDGRRSCAPSKNAETLLEKTVESRIEELLHRREGLVRGLVSQAGSSADTSMIEILRRRCSLKDTELSQLRNELQEMNAAKETLARELREQRENFERERVNLLRPQPMVAADWAIQRNEISVTERCLGKGAWATVSVGLFRGTKVAVKKIHDLILSDFNRELFKREMQMASRCRHPCLLQFIGATTDDGPALLVTELLDASLRSVLNERRLIVKEIVSIALDVSRGLNYLHLSGPSPIIHRDVSSANVLLWRAGDCWRAKLSDYGTANFMRQCGTANPGAPLYVAPEALHVKRQSPKMDVYSFGMLLCEMCIRQLPSVSPQERQAQVNRVPYTGLRSLVTSCVCPDPKKRPDMAHVLREVERRAYQSVTTREGAKAGTMTWR